MQRTLWTSQEIKAATGGEIKRDFSVKDISIDSRQIKGGDLFVAFKGPNFDGHNYVKSALDNGASGAIVDHIPEGLGGDLPLVVVPDVLVALEDLAKAARARSNAKVIGITGSFGKTSMKSALAHVLGFEGFVHASERSFNNHWGVPLTMAKLRPEHEYAVIEMGMNARGEIKSYSELVRPDVAIITNTGDAHLGKLGSIDQIARSKAEIFEGIQPEGAAILCKDDAAFELHSITARKRGATVLSFGERGNPDFECYHKLTSVGLKIAVVFRGKLQEVVLPTFSDRWAVNLAAICATVFSVGGNWELACQNMRDFKFPKGRGNIQQGKGGITIIDESYNAAPTTTSYALATLVTMGKITGKRKIAILGDMLELGDESANFHRSIAQDISIKDIDKVHCCGVEMKALYDSLPDDKKGAWGENPDDITKAILEDVQVGDTYLVKGSRGQWAFCGRMSVFVDILNNCSPSYYR